MQFFPLAFGVLCVATVLAAPSTSNPSFEQLTYSLSSSIQCAYDAIVKLINDVELKNELEELKNAIETIRYDFELCTTNADGRVVKLIKCKVEATKVFLEAKNKFLRAVTAKKWGLAMEIRKEVAKCFMGPKLFELVQLSESSNVTSNDLLGKFKCALKVTEKAVESAGNNELTSIFYEYKPYIQEKLDEMENCIRKQRQCVDEKTIEVLHIFSEMHTNMENNADRDAYEHVVQFIKNNKC